MLSLGSYSVQIGTYVQKWLFLVEALSAKKKKSQIPSYKWIHCITLTSALQKKPEEINRRSSDMWSFAILLWELVTREVPFADLSNMEIGMKVGWPPFLTHPITFKACWNCFSIAPYLVLPACSFRLPWRAWGPQSHLEYRHIFASLWRYAWTKTRRRGLNLIWLCQFWKKCRTNKKNKSFRALLFWTRYDKWWCGAYQYCLKILLCCCIQGHCSFCFWEKFSSSHIFYILNFFLIVISDSYLCLCVTDLPSTPWNYADKYNLLISQLNNLWMSAWTVCVALLNVRLRRAFAHLPSLPGGNNVGWH